MRMVKGYIVSDGTGRSINMVLKDKRCSQKGEFKKGCTPWNKGVHMWEGKKHPKPMLGRKAWNKGLTHKTDTRIPVGVTHPFYGKTHSKSTINVISIKNKGKPPWNKGLTKETDDRIQPCPEERKEQIRLVGKSWKGKKHSSETKKNLSILRKRLYSEGLVSGFKGKHHSEETKKLLSQNHAGVLIGEKNPAWLGGLSFEPYCPNFNQEFRNLIRLRDNFCCLNCGISEQKHLILYARKLAVHHIDYNKKNTCLSNCCTLCHKCNVLANKNRNEWTEFFHSLLFKKYGYEYGDNKVNFTPIPIKSQEVKKW